MGGGPFLRRREGELPPVLVSFLFHSDATHIALFLSSLQVFCITSRIVFVIQSIASSSTPSWHFLFGHSGASPDMRVIWTNLAIGTDGSPVLVGGSFLHIVHILEERALTVCV